MRFVLYHDTNKKTLSIPRAALQLSGLEDAERLTLHVGHGCVALTRQEPTVRERLEAIRLFRNLDVDMVVRLALDSMAAEDVPRRRAIRALQAYDVAFQSLLKHCGVDLLGLGALLAREEDAQ